MTGSATGQERHVFSNWKIVAVPAAWLLATFGFVIAFPIRLSASSQGPEVVIGLAGILIAVVVAILMALHRSKPQRAQPKRLVLGAALCLLAFVVSWGAFDYLKEAWTCSYTSQTRLVVGAEPTNTLLAYIAKAPEERQTRTGVCRMVKEFAGDTLAMFDYPNLALRYYTLIGLYLGVWLSLVWLVFGTVMIVTRRRRQRLQLPKRSN